MEIKKSVLPFEDSLSKKVLMGEVAVQNLKIENYDQKEEAVLNKIRKLAINGYLPFTTIFNSKVAGVTKLQKRFIISELEKKGKIGISRVHSGSKIYQAIMF